MVYNGLANMYKFVKSGRKALYRRAKIQYYLM